MKKILSLFVILFIAGNIFAQKDDILGIWLNQDQDAKIEVFKKGDKYFGKIVWLKKDEEEDGTKPNLDNNNPEEELQSRRILGLEILTDLIWDEDDTEWDDGEIYDPKSGNTYSCYGTIEENNLNLRGYIGFSLIGRTAVWSRSKL